MSKNGPILITGAGGAVGSVSKKMIEMLLKIFRTQVSPDASFSPDEQ